MADTTRAKSAKKPTDHQPKATEKVSMEYFGETFEFDARAPKDSRVILAARTGKMDEAIIRMTNEKDFERLMKAIEDEDGWTDFEDLGNFIDAAYEAAGAKNS